jgi:hypothetical protein
MCAGPRRVSGGMAVKGWRALDAIYLVGELQLQLLGWGRVWSRLGGCWWGREFRRVSVRWAASFHQPGWDRPSPAEGLWTLRAQSLLRPAGR